MTVAEEIHTSFGGNITPQRISSWDLNPGPSCFEAQYVLWTSCDPASVCCTEPFIHICSFVYFESAFQQDVSSTCSQTFTSFTALCRRVIPALKLGHTGIYTSERSLQRQFISLGLLRSGDQINSNKSLNLIHEFAPMTIRKHLHASAQRRQNKGS